MRAGVLYISYDGMLEPLGQSQVLAYLERLAVGRRIHLISFEKAADWQDADRRAAIERRIARSGIRWHPLRYHKSPSAPATAYDIMVGSAWAIFLARRHRLNIVHARSYVPGLMALAAKKLTVARFLFDMRGFWADERVDGGLWPKEGRLYRAAKRAEKRLLLGADHVVTLTRASMSEIGRWSFLKGRVPPITVIPTCANLDRFRIQGPPQREPFVLGYVGSVGTWYLLDEMLSCFVRLKEVEPSARLLIVNRNEHTLIGERLRHWKIEPSAVELIAAGHDDMPKHIARMSAGMALIKPAYSKMASAATKLGEYLGCGVPCLGNVGVGDMAEVLQNRRVGVALPDFEAGSIRNGIAALLDLVREEGLQQRCRSAAEELFSLDSGAAAYASIYDQLAQGLSSSATDSSGNGASG